MRREQILALVDNHMRFGHVSRMKESTLKKFLRMPAFDEHLALHRADCLASHRNLSTYEFIRQKRAEIPEEKMRPAPLVTGDDLIRAGHVPGPKFREILGSGGRCATGGAAGFAGGGAGVCVAGVSGLDPRQKTLTAEFAEDSPSAPEMQEQRALTAELSLSALRNTKS